MGAGNPGKYSKLYNEQAPWGKFGPLGKNFVDYLQDADKKNKKDQLNDEEKSCLNDLKQYLSNSNENEQSQEDAADLQYDEASVDFNKIKNPLSVSWYFTLASFMISSTIQKLLRVFLSESDLNIAGFVKGKSKEGISFLGISKIAEEKLGLNKPENDDKKEKNTDKPEDKSEEKTSEDKPEEEKPAENKQEEKPNVPPVVQKVKGVVLENDETTGKTEVTGVLVDPDEKPETEKSETDKSKKTVDEEQHNKNESVDGETEKKDESEVLE